MKLLYVGVVIALNFLVNFLLLLGTDHLCGYQVLAGKAAYSAALGGIYAGACMLPSLGWLANTFCWLLSLLLMAVVAYGCHYGSLRRGFVFVVLSLALSGFVSGLGGGGLWSILLSAICIFCICRVCLFGSIGCRKLISVELDTQRFLALYDTGNTLTDPLTGKPILVVAAEVAERLTGLSREQLENPTETMKRIPGLRLVPYSAVGTESGLLLAKQFKKVKIGPWQGCALVAFAPKGLSADGEYQALTGGMV